MTALEITGYGISLTTLEDVFMKVGHFTDPSKMLEYKTVPELPNFHDDSSTLAPNI